MTSPSPPSPFILPFNEAIDLPVQAAPGAPATDSELLLALAKLAETEDMRADSELSARSSDDVDGGGELRDGDGVVCEKAREKKRVTVKRKMSGEV